MLLLQGAMAAARIGDSATVRDLVSGAEEAAKQLGGDENHYWTSFGPTNVACTGSPPTSRWARAAGRWRRTSRSTAEGFGAMMPERRAHHLPRPRPADYAQIGDIARASEMLLEADRLAPSEIRCRPIAHELLANILRRTRGTPPPHVAELAEHMGLSP